MNYYNEFDPAAAAWLRELIARKLIPDGIVDERSITEIHAPDLQDFTQCHFFAGIGGWSLALQLAGVPPTVRLWTGSCPCQPYSQAGKGLGDADPRNLWPVFFSLIQECQPAIAFGEQVAGKAGRAWMSGVRSDLESGGYAVGAADLCAAGVGAPHTRQRIYWVADTSVHGCEGLQRRPASQVSQDGASQALGPWHGAGHPFEDWKKLLAEPHVARVVDGVSSTLDIRPRLHAYGNAIVPHLAAEFIGAFFDAIEP